jgi:ferritin
MKAELLTALNHQANHELYASSSYMAMAYWCEAQDYAGFAEFFHKQAGEERDHAAKFFQYLLDKGDCPALTALEAPRSEFGSIMEIALQAESLEKANSDNIRKCYGLAKELDEVDAFPLLLSFIEEQVEEEAWAAKMVSLTRRAECPGYLFNLDRHLIKELEG